MEIAELRKELEKQAKANSQKEADEEMERDAKEELARELEMEQRHEEQMLEMQLARTALKERIDHLNRLILSSKSIGVNANGSLSSYSLNTFNNRFSVGSVRSVMTASNAGRPFLERSTSMASSSSTIGRRSLEKRSSGSGPEAPLTEAEDEDSIGEFGDGTASLAAQNRALQADLADKNRYIQTLEKRLLQARRASSSRTSLGITPGNKILVGEDHSVSTLLREKDAEIAELRARLEDKDRMLAALRSAARSRDNADRVESRTSNRNSRVFSDDGNYSLANTPGVTTLNSPTGSTPTLSKQVSLMNSTRTRTKSVDEMSKMLDDMIQDRVESGQLIRGNRGSIRVAPTPAPTMPPPPPPGPINGEHREPIRLSQRTPSRTPSPPTQMNEPPIKLQLLSKLRTSYVAESQGPVIMEV
jgi:centromeric protein E